MVLLTIAVFVLAVLGFRPISKSIARLHKHVIKLSGGEYDSIPSVGPSELKTFANALNDMAEKVRSRETALRESENNLQMANTTLEAKVTERTADLYATNQALEERTLQLRRLAGELTTAEQRERKQLSKVLHDGLQQYLVAAKMQLSGIGEHCDLSVRQTVKIVDDLLGESVQVSRSLAAELSPPILHDGGISAGLEWLSQFMASKHGLNVKMLSEINSPLLLEEDVKIFLFEATRELLLNVVKHAKTKTAQVSLRKENGGLLCITVSDQGAGFDPKCMRDGYGCFGLFSIRERIGLLGGNFDFESSPGNGATFTLTVPTGEAAKN